MSLWFRQYNNHYLHVTYLLMKFFQRVTTTSLVLIVAIFLTTTGNLKFFSKVIEVYPLVDNVAFLASLLLWLLVFLVVGLLLVCYRYSAKPILILLLIVSAIVGYFANNYSIVFDDNMIANSLETNVAESVDLFSFELIVYVILLGLMPSYWVYKVQIIKENFLQQLWSKLKVIVILLVMFVLITLIFSKSYTFLIRENKQLRLYINPTYYLYAIGKYINSKFETTIIPFKIIAQDALINRADNNKKLIIMVVGETARADRFSLNGYQRMTNPLLINENVISLSQVYSCGTDTAYSLPCMFSNLGRSDYTHVQGKNMSNVLDILSYAGVEILWRDNNSSSKGVADRLTYQDFKSKRLNTICNIECRDEGMLVDLQQYVNAHYDKDMLIILHMMGSHGPTYYKRYPEKFKIFTPICETNQLNKCTNDQINNAYDNTIVYTDYFLSKTINFLKSNQNQFKTAMFYMSDHGESLGENGLYLHGMPYFIAPKEQIHVGSILWFGDEFSKDVDTKLLNKKANTKLSHDGMFHTLLGLMNVDTFVYKKKLDYIRYIK